MTQSTTFQLFDSFLVYTNLDVDWKRGWLHTRQFKREEIKRIKKKNHNSDNYNCFSIYAMHALFAIVTLTSIVSSLRSCMWHPDKLFHVQHDVFHFVVDFHSHAVYTNGRIDSSFFGTSFFRFFPSFNFTTIPCIYLIISNFQKN